MTEEKKKEQQEEEKISLEEQLKKEVEELNEKIVNLEKESNQNLMDFIEKKSKEAEQIILQKEEEMKVKFQKEIENTKNYLYESQFTQLVEIVSNFETAIQMATAPEISAYLVGFKMFSSQFQSLLNDLNIFEFTPALNDEFDSSCMEATAVETVEDKELENKVLKVFSKGYKLNKRVIKLSSVKVGKLD